MHLLHYSDDSAFSHNQKGKHEQLRKKKEIKNKKIELSQHITKKAFKT